MRYPWVFLSIVSLWFAIALIMYNASDRTDPTTLYIFGVVFTTILALRGFRADA